MEKWIASKSRSISFTDLKGLQSIASIREEMEAYGEKPLVNEMVELDTGRADNAEETEVKVDMRTIQKDLITVDATHLESEVEDLRASPNFALMSAWLHC